MARRRRRQDRAKILRSILETTVSLDIDRLWAQMLGVALDAWLAGRRAGISEDTEAMLEQIERELDRLSDRLLEDLARKSSAISYNEGRAAAILTANDVGAVDFVIRSELLDGETCEPCARLDSTVIAVDSDEFFDLMPPSHCEGRGNCRGIFIPVSSRRTQ